MAKKNANDDELSEAAEPQEQLVPRDLSEDEVRDRQIQLANTMVEMLDLEEKRRKSVKKANDRITELKGELYDLANQVRTKVEMVPAQLKLEDAIKSRRSVARGQQDKGKPVEP